MKKVNVGQLGPPTKFTTLSPNTIASSVNTYNAQDSKAQPSGILIPQALGDQLNTVLHHEEVWRMEPKVGSGVHVAVAIVADLNPADRSVHCHCEVALLDTDSGGFLGIGISPDVAPFQLIDVGADPAQTVDVLKDVDFSSDETVLERATVSLLLTNRRRPS